MDQLKIFLHRLKKPSVIISIASEAVMMLTFFHFDIDADATIKTITTLVSLLVTMGILSNPDSSKAGYGDDITVCSGCGEETKHVLVNGEMLCENCGSPAES